MIRDAFDHPTWLVITLIVGVITLGVLTASQNRRYLARTERKQCRHCGALFAANARFCGRCGKSF